jgi:hypothetical protein
MGWLHQLLRWADKSTDLADRAASLDDQAEVNFKFSPLARAATWLAGAYAAASAVVSGLEAVMNLLPVARLS